MTGGAFLGVGSGSVHAAALAAWFIINGVVDRTDVKDIAVMIIPKIIILEFISLLSRCIIEGFDIQKMSRKVGPRTKTTLKQPVSYP